MTSATYRESVGDTILDQLAYTSGGAGAGRLRAMVGATEIEAQTAGRSYDKLPKGSPGVGFRFRGYLLDFGRILQEADYEIRAQLIWRKQQIVISRGHYHGQHEPCWYAVRKGATAAWKGDRKQSTVWDIPNLLKAIRDDSTNPDARQELVAQKPVECMERPIRNHEGDVYDPFVGSGTTIIAAERQDRTCYAMEIAPQYVDAAVKR